MVDDKIGISAVCALSDGKWKKNNNSYEVLVITHIIKYLLFLSSPHPTPLLIVKVSSNNIGTEETVFEFASSGD